jgi:ribosomal protein L7Ae-like RNA K-turn-binding protein
MNKQDKVLSMVGLAKKAGKLAAGSFLAEKAVRDGWAELLIVAEDAAQNIKKKFSNSSEYYEIDYMEYGTKETLGHFTGYENIAVVAITDAGLAKAIEDKYNTLESK